MVLLQQLSSGGLTFTICPNASMDWLCMKRTFVFLASCVGSVAIWCAAQGAWLVLPFAGLEILVLGIGFYLNALWITKREVILIEGDEIRIWRGRRDLLEVACFPRHWTRVALISDPHGWYPSRLLLECRGKGVEVGKVLVEGERDTLVADLRVNLRIFSAIQSVEPVSEPQGLRTAGQQTSVSSACQ